MSGLYGCDRELMYEINQLEELDCFPNYNTTLSQPTQLTGSMAYAAMPGQSIQTSTIESIPVQQWTTLNCVEWAEKICYQYSLDKFSVDIGSLSNSTGSHLMQLSLQDFCLMLGDYYGQLFYRELQALINAHHVVADQSSGRFISSPDLNTIKTENYDYNQDFYNNSYDMYQPKHEDLTSSSYTDNSNLYGYNESFDYSGATGSNFDDSFNDIYDDNSLENVQFYDLDSNSSIGMLTVDMGVLQIKSSPNHQTDYTELASKDTCQIKTEPNTSERIPRRSRINKEVNVSDNAVQDLCKNIKGSGKYIRCPKTWEFLMRLLVNSETNPEVICWEDEAQYIFRLVEPRKIIEIWNTKTGKSSGNYDNFARSLRYHYKKGILIPVPERQLVYRCGPLAIDYLLQLKSQSLLSL